MKKMYHAIKAVSIGGKSYNSGEIVWSENSHPSLRPIAGNLFKWKSPEKKLPESPYFCGENPVVSVIITFHNQLKFVQECLDSFKNQSLKLPYEMIVVVDASQQDEVATIRAQYPKVRVYATDYANANLARNYGLEQTTADIVTFFDGDDYVFGTYLEKLYHALTPEGVHNIDFSYARFEHDMFGLKQGKLPRCNIFEWSESWAKYSPITNTPIMIWKSVCPLWGNDLKVFQDAAFGLELVKRGLKGKHIREKLWYYREHEENSNHISGYMKYRESELELMSKEYGLKREKAEVTFVSLLCRDEVLDEYFAQIKHLGLPKQTHWFIMVDSNDDAFIDKIKEYQEKHEYQFLSSRMFVTGETNEAYSRDFETRGMRIANFIKLIINQVAERIGGTEFFFMVEDDTIAPKNAYRDLKPLMKDPKVAYASGIEPGRGYSRHTGVCYLKENEKGEIWERNIPSMQNSKGKIRSDIIPIEGGGWYCWIGRTSQMADFIFHKKFRCVDGKMLGPDVMMVYDLVKFGFKALCNMAVQCSHYCPDQKKWLHASEGVGYRIEYYQRNDGIWRMKMYKNDGSFFEMTQ